MNKNKQENIFSNFVNESKISNENLDQSGDIELKDLTEIDIFSSKYGFDETFVEKMLKPECKWNEKKKAFDDLAKCTEPTKIKYIKNTDRSYFIDMVKKLLKQPNINVVHSIITALNNIALGLKTNFIEAKDLFPYLLNYLKEKKENIINSLLNCLSDFSLFMNDNIISEKLINYCSGKGLCNSAKINLCSLLEKIFDKKGNTIQLNTYSYLLVKISKYLEDQNPQVRERSAKLMAYINFIKKDLFNSIANTIKLDNKKRDKISEYEKLYINLSYNNKAQINVASYNKSEEKIKESTNNVKQKTNGKKLLDYDSINQLNQKENKRLTKENNYISEVNCLSMIKDELIRNKEEIISYMQNNINNLNHSLFNSLKWEERKEGFCFINDFINDEKNLEEIKLRYDYYFKYILINNKSFNEKNFLVLNESIHCISSLIEKVEEFANKYYKIIISLLINKLKEKKVFPEIQILIKIFLSKLPKKEVLMTLINSLEKQQINIVKEGIEIINNCINDSKDLNDFPLQELINFYLKLEDNSNNIIKKASMQLLTSIYQKIGKEIYIYLKDINETLLSKINEEFNKDEKDDKKTEETLEDIDISEKITEKMIKDLKEGKWFEKKNVIEQIEGIISQSNHNIITKGLSELIYAIKNNLSDGNKNIVKLSIQLVSELLDAFSPGLSVKTFVSIIISSLISNFSETKNSIKDLSVNCVNKIITLIGIESIINDLSLQLKTENFDIKNEILQIFLNNKYKVINQKENKELLYSLINCLLDKNNNIRNNAKNIIQEMMQFISPNLLTDYINKLKPSYAKQINDIIYDKSSNNVSKAKSIISNESQIPKTNKKIKSKNPIINLSKKSETSSKINIQTPFKLNNEEINIYSTGKKYFSKSPILASKSNEDTKYNFNILDVLPPELNELTNYIQNLDNGEIPMKIMALTEIKKILIHFVEKNEFNKNYINDILITFNKLVYILYSKFKTKEAFDKNEIVLLRYLLDDYIYIANKNSLINSLSDENLIYNCYEKLFLLISENEIKSIANSSEILSILNTTILCLLTNFDKTLTIISLINLISTYKSNQECPLITSLSIKCLNKFCRILSKIKNKINNNTIFVSFYYFFFNFSKTNDKLEPGNETENNALLMINEFIKEYINIYGDKIWNFYNEALDDNKLKMDIYLKRTIELLYKEIRSDNISIKQLNINLGVKPEEDAHNEIIKEIMFYVNEIKNNGINMNEEQMNNCYFEIVSLLRINKLDISLLKDKMDKNIFEKIFEIYYGIKEDNDSKSSAKLSLFNPENNKSQLILPENNEINKKIKKEISEQSKRIMEYKNKIKYLTESDGLRNEKTSIKENDENKQMNNCNFIENKMKQLDEISFLNKNKRKNTTNIYRNNNIIDEISNMKKKLKEIRQKIN